MLKRIFQAFCCIVFSVSCSDNSQEHEIIKNNLPKVVVTPNDSSFGVTATMVAVKLGVRAA